MLAYRRDGAWVEWQGEPMPLAGEGSYRLPAGAEALYSDADLSKYGLHRVTVDPVPAGHRQTGRSLVDSAGVPRLVPISEPIPLDDLKAARRAEAEAEKEARIAAGAPYGGHHIALDPASRSDISGMGATALAASSGAIAWPASYALGWISIENIRVPMPTPADGLALAAAVGDWYATVVQHCRDLKDLIDAAEDAAALAAIDVGAGWSGYST